MTTSQDVALKVATARDAPLLANLLQLYLHDMSEIFPIELDEQGRYAYGKLARYWAEPGTHFAFLIHSGERIVGFALVTRGSPASDDPDVLDVAEFFVLRRHRRSGVGRQAAFLLWDRLPGRWIVRVSEGNPGGVAFWTDVVAAYAKGRSSESRRDGAPHRWRVFAFDSPEREPGGGP